MHIILISFYFKDRHSIWISNCIGAGNNKLYLLTMASLFMLNVTMVLVCYAMITSSADVPPLSELFTFIQFVFAEFMFSLIVAAANVISLGYAGTFFFITLYGACTNGTYNEMDNYSHYDYLHTKDDRCDYANPFDLGSVSANVQEFLFGGNRNWYTYSVTSIVEKDSKV